MKEGFQDDLMFKIKGHTYKDIVLQSLLLPALSVEHEDFALPQRGTRGQSSTANAVEIPWHLIHS